MAAGKQNTDIKIYLQTHFSGEPQVIFPLLFTNKLPALMQPAPKLLHLLNFSMLSLQPFLKTCAEPEARFELAFQLKLQVNLNGERLTAMNS